MILMGSIFTERSRACSNLQEGQDRVYIRRLNVIEINIIIGGGKLQDGKGFVGERTRIIRFNAHKKIE